MGKEKSAFWFQSSHSIEKETFVQCRYRYILIFIKELSSVEIYLSQSSSYPRVTPTHPRQTSFS